MKDVRLNQALPNGATVVAFFETQGDGIVLAHREGAYQPYVTWAYEPGHSDSTTWGHYFDTLDKAWEDFESRIARNK
jgi:hypothetical protein